MDIMEEVPPPLEINPPLLNAACPWATTLDDLRRLYACPWTGAVTTRTSLIHGFDHDPAKHQYTFFDAGQTGLAPNASINSFGYSPLALESYLGFIKTISDEQSARSSKGFIVSVTGDPEDIERCYKLIATAAQDMKFPLAMEINLSCPNIPNRQPPAYSQDLLSAYLFSLQRAIATGGVNLTRIPVGLKTPPYTHATEYQTLIAALEQAAANTSSGGVCPLSFITATNTLGMCLVVADDGDLLSSPAGPGFGGVAGAPLHPLALGNVAMLRRLLDSNAAKLGHIRVVGVGGVLDEEGFRRMMRAGAHAVAVATGLGLKGVGIFEEIGRGTERRQSQI
jgi:dihydroorotate dehydrogenase (fumarate)